MYASTRKIFKFSGILLVGALRAYGAGTAAPERCAAVIELLVGSQSSDDGLGSVPQGVGVSEAGHPRTPGHRGQGGRDEGPPAPGAQVRQDRAVAELLARLTLRLTFD